MSPYAVVGLAPEGAWDLRAELLSREGARETPGWPTLS